MIPSSPALTPEVLQAAIDYADEHTLQKPEDDYMARWRANVCARLSLSALTPDRVAERLTAEVLYRAYVAFITTHSHRDMRAVLVEAITAGLPASAADEPRTMRPPQMGPAYDPVVEQHRDLIRPLRDGAALRPPPACDGCDRLAACVRTRRSAHGETEQCCRCTASSDADGWCEACRPPEPPAPHGSEVLCPNCAHVFCPSGERLHFHHDGCPACHAAPPQEGS